MRFTESLTSLPAEYRETEGPIYGALVDNVSADGMHIYTGRDIPAGSKLNLGLFYANEYELNRVKVVANIVSKGLHIAEDWKGYRYELGCVQMSEEDRRKLNDLLNNHSKLEQMSGREDRVPGESSLMKDSLPLLPNLDLPTGSNAKCTFYENGKCVKTLAFCDLCQTEDETILVLRASTTQKSRSHRTNRLRGRLSKLAEKLALTSRH